MVEPADYGRSVFYRNKLFFNSSFDKCNEVLLGICLRRLGLTFALEHYAPLRILRFVLDQKL